MIRRLCLYCGRWYRPDVRTAQLQVQKACRRKECGKARKQAADRAWRRNNPKSREVREQEREWAKKHRDYWRRWRANHGAYRERERERVGLRRLRVAKEDAIRRDPVGYLEGIRSLGSVAKEDAIGERLDGIVDYLEACSGVAKANDMAIAAHGAG
jgi:hypothetical protein